MIVLDTGALIRLDRDDASVVVTARRRQATVIYTSDPDDIRCLLTAAGDKTITVVRC